MYIMFKCVQYFALLKRFIVVTIWNILNKYPFTLYKIKDTIGLVLIKSTEVKWEIK